MKKRKQFNLSFLKVSLIVFSIALLVGGLFSSYLPTELADLLFGNIGLGSLVAAVGIGGEVTTDGGAGEGVATTTSVSEKAEELNKYDLDKQVIMCRPEDVPLDQLLRRLGGGSPSKSQRFEFYRATQNDSIYTTHATAITGKGKAGGGFVLTLDSAAYDLLPTDVIAFADESLLGYKWNHKGQVGATPEVPLVVYILKKLTPTTYDAIVINDNADVAYTVNIPANSIMFTIGNAQNETAVMTDAFNLLPVKDANYAQRFMKTVAESDYQAMIDKEVNWGIAQYRNASMYSLRSQIELAMFIGQMRLDDPKGDGHEVYYTGGFENFIGDRVTDYNGVQPTLQDMQTLGKEVFSNTNGSAERFMFLSPTAMQKILAIPQFIPTGSNVNLLQTADAVDLKGEKIGFSVKKIDTGYGIINLVPHRGLTRRRENTAYVIDIANVRRRVVEKLAAKTYDLEELAISKSTAIVLSECVGLEFQNMDTMQLLKF